MCGVEKVKVAKVVRVGEKRVSGHKGLMSRVLLGVGMKELECVK